MKDHEIAILVNCIRDKLNERIPNLPQCLRGLISEAVVDSLEKQGLRVDKKESE